jgi:hypothetical protein
LAPKLASIDANIHAYIPFGKLAAMDLSRCNPLGVAVATSARSDRIQSSLSGNRMFRRLVTIGAAGLVVASASAAHALTPEQVSAGFREGTVRYCLEAALRGVTIGELPEGDRTGLAPASPSIRDMVRATNPTGPLWDVLSAQGIVVVSEPAPGACEVLAYGPPVERTFKAVLKDAKKRSKALADVPVKPGYDPIVYRLEQADGGAKIALDLSGAEPGAPGHFFRFSMLNAKVTREAAAP